MLRQSKVNYTQLMEVFTGLIQATRCCCQDEAFCEGVTFHQFTILDLLARNKELKMADLHRHLGVEKSTTTRLVNPLIKKRLLQKRTDPEDLRAAKLILTKKGVQTHQKACLCVMDFFHNITGNIPEKKVGIILESVKIFIEATKTYARQSSCC
ncbi:MAG TPA: MarR family transcriptional regulator [Deltaproteobacteria bacterium]|mgnify:CR=1 FL=1|nr:MarR family transcriptional regulator [Deltaproteobacteria bacterium]